MKFQAVTLDPLKRAPVKNCRQPVNAACGSAREMTWEGATEVDAVLWVSKEHMQIQRLMQRKRD